MKRMLLPGLTAFAATLGLAACSGMSDRQRDTAAGAAIGGVAGSVLSDGSPVGTVGGAAIGGVIGGKKKEEERRN